MPRYAAMRIEERFLFINLFSKCEGRSQLLSAVNIDYPVKKS